MRRLTSRPIGQRHFVALGFVLVIALPFFAAARDAAPSVPVEVTACGDDILPAVRERLAVEVEILWRESYSPPEMASLRVAIRCEGDVARVEVAATGETSRSSVDLVGLDREARSRLLALKATELIHLVGEKTWERSASARGDGGAGAPPLAEDAARAPHGEQPPAPAAVPDAGAPPNDSSAAPTGLNEAPASPALRARGERSSISAGAFALFAGRPVAYLIGPSLVGEIRILPRLSLGADVAGTFGSLQRVDRRLSLQGGAGSVALHFGGHAGSTAWALGAGGRMGLLQMSGHVPANAGVAGKTASGIWAGPMIAADLSYPLASSRWFVDLGAEGGWIALPLAALVDQSAQFYAFKGPWAGLRVAVGLDLADR